MVVTEMAAEWRCGTVSMRGQQRRGEFAAGSVGRRGWCLRACGINCLVGMRKNDDARLGEGIMEDFEYYQAT